MEEKERSRSPSRRTSRVEQVVGRWLRRSRESTSRERTAGEAKSSAPGWSGAAPIKLTVKIPRDPRLDSHGFEISAQRPLLVTEVTAGGPAEGRLVPGDQVLAINNVMVDDLSAEQATEIIKESWDYVTVMVLRHSAGPKSSFMTAEKRARLKTNPVKVHFAEEVIVNGHTQGNSLLFLPNVLKVYLENGQTKAFKFEAKTTVKDILFTLKEKLSIRSIEHFALVLEEQYSITKLLLLHEDEHIQQVVHRKETHDYRCLFRVCFIPRDPLHLLQADPVAFEYLYLQSVNDVLQERFAVEMKCNTALRLAALHIHERLDSCGHTHRASLKSIAKNWGIENFISPTLLRNMNEKDLRKAVNYHLKKIQAMLEPRQKIIPATQARLNYLAQLSELQSYGGKCFTATILFQDSECMVDLLVGARYGISQVINHKLNIVTILTEFSSITRVDLLPESERVSLVKIYLQDVKQITLLMESMAAKDFSCLVTGYCRLYVDPAQSVFSWSSPAKAYHISTEGGYVCQHGSNPEDSTLDSSDSMLVDLHFSIDDIRVAPAGQDEKQKEDKNKRQEEMACDNNVVMEAAKEGLAETEKEPSETTSWCHTSLHPDSLSLDNLEDDDLLTASSGNAFNLEVNDPYLLDTPVKEKEQKGNDSGRSLDSEESRNNDTVQHCDDEFLSFADLSRLADSLPSPPEATDEEEELQRAAVRALRQPHDGGVRTEEHGEGGPVWAALTLDCVDCATEGCERVQVEGSTPGQDAVVTSLLQPSPSFVDSSSEDEFFDAHDRFIQATATEKSTESFMDRAGMTRTLNLHNLNEAERDREEEEEKGEEEWEKDTPQGPINFMRCFRKRRSFIETNFTSQVSFPAQERKEQEDDKSQSECSEMHLLEPCPLQRSVKKELSDLPDTNVHHVTDPPASCGSLMSEKHIQLSLSTDEMETEPDTMEYKPVRGLLSETSVIAASVYSHGPTEDKKFGPKDGAAAGAIFDLCLALDSIEASDEVQLIDSVMDVLDSKIPHEDSASEQETHPFAMFREQDVKGSQAVAEVQVNSALQPQVLLSSLPLDPLTTNSLSAGEIMQDEHDKVDTEAECESVITDQQPRNSSCLTLATKKGISHSCESLLLVNSETPDTGQAGGIIAEELTNCDTQNRTSGIVGRLSNSTLRDKFRKLPCCLSRSQEHLGTLVSNGTDESQVVSEDTEVTEVVTDDVEKVGRLTEKAPKNTIAESVVEMKLLKEVTQVRSNTDSERSELNLSLTDVNLEICKHPVLTLAGQPEGVDSLASGDHAGEVIDGTQSKQPKPLPHPYTQEKADVVPTPVLQVTRASRESCGCRTAYSNCFRGEPDRSTFDEEATVHEFSCRTQGTEVTRLTTAAPPPFPSPSVPVFPRGTLPRSSSSELSPLLSPLDPPDCCPSESLQEVLAQLRGHHYVLPGGFALLQHDLLELLTVLQVEPRAQARHHWETCVAHLSENKHLLHAEARHLMSDCQRVIRVGQSPEEMLRSLSQSFHTLVQLASTCLGFSSCCQCDASLAEVLGGLRGIAEAYGDFSQAAELACGRKSCHDLSIKVLARQCTSLTASVFCLTQLYCTLAAL